MKENAGEKSLKSRIREGEIRRRDVTRRLAELAFGKANDCVRLALEDDPLLDKLDLSLLSEVKRNDKGTVEIKLIDRLRALEHLALVAEEEKTDLEALLQALQEDSPCAMPPFRPSRNGCFPGGFRETGISGRKPLSAMGRCGRGRPWPWGCRFFFGP